jgi:hypothetical protein
MSLSAYPFCHGDRGATGRSRMPIARVAKGERGEGGNLVADLGSLRRGGWGSSHSCSLPVRVRSRRTPWGVRRLAGDAVDALVADLFRDEVQAQLGPDGAREEPAHRSCATALSKKSPLMARRSRHELLPLFKKGDGPHVNQTISCSAMPLTGVQTAPVPPAVRLWSTARSTAQDASRSSIMRSRRIERGLAAS